MKKFYSIRLRHERENVPVDVAQKMLIAESNLIRWLDKHKALQFKYIKSRHRLDLYATEKFLTMGKMMYPEIFDGKGRMGFMEIYINNLLRKKIQIARGSS